MAGLRAALPPPFGTPENPAEHLADQDVIYVSGGNTANALTLWRLHAIDATLLAAWETGNRLRSRAEFERFLSHASAT